MRRLAKPTFIKTLLLVFGQLLPFCVIAQINSLRFEKLDISNASSFPNVDCIYEDSRGFMWFGAYSGLFMYDGFNLTHFQNNPNDPLSISDNKVTRILEDNKGNFWIGTQNGMNYFNIKKRTFKRYNDKGKCGIGIVGINEIKKDSHNNIWVGTNDGLYVMDSTYQWFNRYTAQFNNILVGAFELSEKGVYVSIEKKLFYKDYQSDSFDLISLPTQKSLTIGKLLKDDYGILWLGSDEGLFYINTLFNNRQVVEQPLFKNKYIRFILKKSKDELWINTKTELFLLNIKTSQYQKYAYNPLFTQGYPNNTLYNGFFSSSNILWTQKSGEDIYTVDINKHRFQNVPITIMDNVPWVACLFELYEYSPNTLLIRQKNGAGFLNTITGKITPFEYKPDYNLEGWQKGIICFWEENDGKLWIGVDGGLFLFDKKVKRFINLESQIKGFDIFRKKSIRKIYKDRQGYLWVVTWWNGVFKVNFREKTIASYFQTNEDNINLLSSSRSILEAKNGQIWVGARGGLCKYMPEADSFKIYKNSLNDPESMSENTAFCIYEDEKENIWVGTYGGGLNKLDVKTEKFKHFTADNGLLNNNVFSLLPDKKGNLWLNTFVGISVFNPYTQVFKNYKNTDGLINKAFNAFLHGKGRYSDRFFFAGNQGIDFFYPDSIHLSTLDPNIYLTDFKLFNRSVSISRNDKDSKVTPLSIDIAFTKHLTLAYEQNVIGFDFVALDYSAPKNIQYAYILEGFDTAWQYIGNNRSATFTNLNPGDYTFKVKATNSDGVWGTKTASIKLTVLAPWWRTWWFRTLVVLTLFSLGFAFYQYRIRQIKEREAIKTTLNKRIAEVKMEALRSQMNPHFIFNALTSINLFILKNDTETASFYLNKFSRLMREVLDHSRSELITVEEEINTLKVYIDIEKMRFKNTFNFVLDVQPNARIGDIQVPPLIIQPYVENAIWHGLKHKKDGAAVLKIAVFEDTDYFYILVEDNGVGRTKAMEMKKYNSNQHTSHGLNITEERVKQYYDTHHVETYIETIDLISDTQQPIGTQIVFKIKTTH